MCVITPQQNGVAKRKNMHFTKMHQSMIHAKNVLEKFWAECTKTTAHIINRFPQPRLEFVSPFEKI